MNRRQYTPLCHLIVFALCSSAMLSMPLAEAKYAGHTDETILPFGPGEVQPELTGAFMIQTMRTKIGEPDKKGMQRIRLKFDVRNMTDKDYIIHLTATLLDAEGQTIAMKIIKKKIDDEERENIGLRFMKLSTDQVSKIKDLKIRVVYEKE